MVFNRFAVLAVFALSTFSSIVSSLSGNPLSSSAIFSRSVSDFCPPTARACGSRKVGLVVDSSGSNKETDPSDLRVAAARDFADRLISSSEATTKSKADRVTVVDFDHSTEVVYPLGDPAGANFSGIGSSGDTYIASGVRAAVSEITSVSQDQTTGTSGLVVFTDGEDSNQAELVTEIQKTGSMGIRVHFAFLDPTGRATQRPKLLSAILGTGGIYGTMSSPQAQKSFVDLVYSQSLTAQDNPNPNGTTGLLPGLTVARFMSSSTPVKFSYQGLAGEKVNFAVKSLSSQILSCSLRDGKKEVASAATTASGGGAAMAYEVPKDATLNIEVTARSGDGVMTMQPLTDMPNATRPLANAAATTTGNPSPLMLVGMSLLCLAFAGTVALG